MRWQLAFVLSVGLTSIGEEASASASPDAAWTRAATLQRSVAGGVGVVLSRDAAAAAPAVCVAPVRQPGGLDADSREVARRGGVESVEPVGGVAIWCVAIAARELPFALWLAHRQLLNAAASGAEETARGGDSAESESLAATRALALEGTAGAPSAAGRHAPVLVIVGAPSPDDLRSLAAWSNAPLEEPAPLRPPTWSLHQTSERLSVIEGDVTAPAVRYGWAVPDVEPQDRALLEATARVLGGSPSARLPRLLVQRGLARRAESWAVELGGGALVGIWLELSSRGSIDRTRRFADGTVKQLRLVGPSPREAERARHELRLEALRDWESPERRARRLTWYEFTLGDASRWLEEIRSLDAVSAGSMKRFAREHLVDARRTTVEVYPPKWPTDDPALSRHQLYTTVPGDTLDALAARFRVSATRLARTNDLDPKYGLTPGQPLWIPPE
jgi:hypothetical protein